MALDIPLGMSRSVENVRIFLPVHPDRDASLSGCRFCMVFLCSTERLIPNGMRCKETTDVLKALICFLFFMPQYIVFQINLHPYFLY